MALITKASNVSIDVNTSKRLPPISPLTAGEDLAAGAPCYIHSDGDVRECISTVVEFGEVEYVGFTPIAYLDGEVVTLFGKGLRLNYASGMTPGTQLWVSATAGRLEDVPIAGKGGGEYEALTTDEPVAIVVTATDIVVIK